MRCAVPEEKGKLLVPDDNRPAPEDVSKLAAKNLAFLVELGAGFASLTTAEDILALAGEKIYRHFGASRMNFSDVDMAASEVTVFYGKHDGSLTDDAIYVWRTVSWLAIPRRSSAPMAKPSHPSFSASARRGYWTSGSCGWRRWKLISSASRSRAMGRTGLA